MLQTFIFVVFYFLSTIESIPLKNVSLGYCGKMETTFEIDHIPDETSEEFSDYSDNRYLHCLQKVFLQRQSGRGRAGYPTCKKGTFFILLTLKPHPIKPCKLCAIVAPCTKVAM